MLMLSGSSDRWSLFGHQRLAPVPSHATATHGFPDESFVQIIPPSHGGFFASCGLPEYFRTRLYVVPGLSGSFSAINTALNSRVK